MEQFDLTAGDSDRGSASTDEPLQILVSCFREGRRTEGTARVIRYASRIQHVDYPDDEFQWGHHLVRFYTQSAHLADARHREFPSLGSGADFGVPRGFW